MSTLIEDGLRWIELTTDLGNWKRDLLTDVFRHHVSDLGFSNDGLECTPEKFKQFLRDTLSSWWNTPYLWDALSTFDRWSDYRARFE